MELIDAILLPRLENEFHTITLSCRLSNSICYVQNAANGNKHEYRCAEIEQSNAMQARNWKFLGKYGEQETNEFNLQGVEKKGEHSHLGIRMRTQSTQKSIYFCSQ